MIKAALYVCTGKHCKEDGAKKTLARLRANLQSEPFSGQFRAEACGCLNKCGKGPAVRIEPQGLVLKRVKPKKCESLLQELLLGPLPDKLAKKEPKE